jgi:hypothetical protein
VLWTPRQLVSAAVLVLAAGCGATPGTSSPGTATPAPKPATAAQAVLDAVPRTASFRDITYSTATTITTGPRTDRYSGTITATTTPPRLDLKTIPASGAAKLHTIEDFTAKLFCTFPEGKPSQQFPDTNTADTIDPFNAFKAGGIVWAYEPDADVSGHTDWRVLGSLPQDAANPTIIYTVNTREVFIDPRSGRIERTVQHTRATQNGSAESDLTITSTSFRYDTGVTVAAC